MSITPLPPAPSITDTTSEFNTKAFNFVAALDPFANEANALLETCEDAAGTASAALAVVGAVAWVSGTTYAIGDPVYSPIDLQTYRRKTIGAGTTDPSLDSTNWSRVDLAPPPPLINSISAIATGTLPNGTTVSLNPNGTVSAFGGTYNSATGTPQVFASSSTAALNVLRPTVSSTIDQINNKIIIAYMDTGNSNFGTAVVGTINNILGNTSITFGTPVIFSANSTNFVSITFDSANNKVVIIYQNVTNSDFGTAIVGTVSGNTISFGSATVFNSASTSTTNCIFDTVSQKVFVAYVSSGQKMQAATVSGSSITFGAVATYVNVANSKPSLAFDPVQNHILMIVHDGNDGSAFCGVFRISGTTVTQIATGDTALNSIYFTTCCFDTLTNRFIAFLRSDPAGTIRSRIVTISGSSVIFQDGGNVTNAPRAAISCDYDRVNNKVVFVYTETTSNIGRLISGTVGASTITYDSAITFSSSSTTNISSVYSLDLNKLIISYTDVENSNFGTSVVYTAGGFFNNNFIGFSSAAYTNGQTATIKTIGATVDNQSELLLGKKYYVASNGSLTTSVNTNFAGSALTATQLLVKG